MDHGRGFRRRVAVAATVAVSALVAHPLASPAHRHDRPGAGGQPVPGMFGAPALPSARTASSTTPRILYLPHVQSVVPSREPCGVPVREACAGGTGWTVVCGGMGRIRDMFAPEDGSGTVIVVGDGAGRLRLGTGQRADPGGRDAGSAFTWQAQVGRDLTGLNALFVDRADDGAATGWAVGDQNQIITLGDACWDEFALASRDASVELHAIRARELNGRFVAWAVGENRPGRAAVFELPFDQGWNSHSDIPKHAPALTDVVFDPFPPGLNERPGAWAVGADLGRREGVFLRADPAGWGVAQTTGDGWPRELVMGGDNGRGRAFGTTWGDPAVVSWILKPAPRRWELDPDFARPGLDLVDAYSLVDSGRVDAGIWLGLVPASNPAQRGPLSLDHFDWAANAWTTFTAPFDVDLSQAAGSRAIALVQDPASGGAASVLFAWGDDVWRFDPARDTWTRLRSRLRLTDHVPDAGRGWLLADDDAGARLLFLEGDQVRRGVSLDVDLDPDLVGRHMHDLAGGGGVTWVVGDDGLSVRLRGPLHRTDVFAVPDGGSSRLTGVAVTPRGDAWAVGLDRAGRSRLWTFGERDAGWRAVPGADAERFGSLGAIAAGPDGSVWAVGDGTSVHIRPGCGAEPAEMCRCADAVTGPLVCRYPLPPVGRDRTPARATSVAAPVAGRAWAAGDQLVFAAREGEGWTKLPELKSGDANLLRAHEAIVALAVAAPDDVWVVTHCGRRRDARDLACGAEPPIASRVFRFDGRAWREATRVNVPIFDIDIATDGGTRTVWLTGDWTTVLRYSYGVGSDGGMQRELPGE